MNFAEFLRKYKCSKWKLARHLKIPRKTVVGWCSGIGCPNGRQAMEISFFLPCDLKELYLAILKTPIRDS